MIFLLKIVRKLEPRGRLQLPLIFAKFEILQIEANTEKVNFTKLFTLHILYCIFFAFYYDDVHFEIQSFTNLNILHWGNIYLLQFNFAFNAISKRSFLISKRLRKNMRFTTPNN